MYSSKAKLSASVGDDDGFALGAVVDGADVGTSDGISLDGAVGTGEGAFDIDGALDIVGALDTDGLDDGAIDTVGKLLGMSDGAALGWLDTVGCAVRVGAVDGTALGQTDGAHDGIRDTVGAKLGDVDGAPDGTSAGICVGPVAGGCAISDDGRNVGGTLSGGAAAVGPDVTSAGGSCVVDDVGRCDGATINVVGPILGLTVGMLGWQLPTCQDVIAHSTAICKIRRLLFILVDVVVVAFLSVICSNRCCRCRALFLVFRIRQPRCMLSIARSSSMPSSSQLMLFAIMSVARLLLLLLLSSSSSAIAVSLIGQREHRTMLAGRLFLFLNSRPLFDFSKASLPSGGLSYLSRPPRFVYTHIYIHTFILASVFFCWTYTSSAGEADCFPMWNSVFCSSFSSKKAGKK